MINACPCCSTKNYIECCQPYITNKQLPPTPEALMRSRYTAYTQANVDYIAQTMLAPAANHFNAEEARLWARDAEWQKLEVLNSHVDGKIGFVEFIAYFHYQKTPQTLHEKSEFHLVDQKWMYVDGNYR